MRIAHGGFDILMAQQYLHNFQGDALHHQVRGKSMAQVVEVKIINSGPAAGALKGCTDIA